MAERAAARKAAAVEAEPLLAVDCEHNRHLLAGHHWHAYVNYTICSCGTPGGVWTVSVDPRYWSDDPAEQEQAQREDRDFQAWLECDICGQRGTMNDEHTAWPPQPCAQSSRSSG